MPTSCGSPVRALIEPVEITDEALGLDVIDEVGPGGLFLKHKHTRRHARDRFEPHVFDRHTYEDWEKAGRKDATQVAAERVDEILATHRPEPLPEGAARTIDAIVERAEADAGA